MTITPKQRMHVAMLRMILGMIATDPDFKVKDASLEDLIRLIKNDEFIENGLDGVRLVESQLLL